MKEFVSHNILEESHINIFSPFHTILMFFGACRVDARDRFVTPPTFSQKIYSLSWLVLLFTLYMAIFFTMYLRFIQNPAVGRIIPLALVLYYGIHIYLVIHVRFTNQEANAKFFLKLHEINQKMKIDTGKRFDKILYKSNLLAVLIVTVPIIILYILALIECAKIFVYFIVLVFTQEVFGLECWYYSNLITYFSMRLSFINGIIYNHIIEITAEEIKPFNDVIFSIKKIKAYEECTEHKFENCDTESYLRHLFDTLTLFQHLYKHEVSKNTFILFFLLFASVELNNRHYNR